MDVSWHRAATEVGNRILAIKPTLLVMVSGLDYATHLEGVRDRPVTLAVPNRVVYVAHDYPWFWGAVVPYEVFASAIESQWAYIALDASVGANVTAPVFVSEFGTCHTGLDCIQDVASAVRHLRLDNGLWFTYFARYAKEHDLDWAFWALNGSTCDGTGRVPGAEETFGLLNMCWNAYVYPPLLEAIQALQPPTSGP